MDIVIEDEYVNEMRSQLVNDCYELEIYIEQYITALKAVKESGLIEGKTADALAQMIEEVMPLNDYFEQVGYVLDQCCDNFIVGIDKADEHLY